MGPGRVRQCRRVSSVLTVDTFSKSIKKPFKLRSGSKDTTRAGFLFVEGTGMREQGSLKGRARMGRFVRQPF